MGLPGRAKAEEATLQFNTKREVLLSGWGGRGWSNSTHKEAKMATVQAMNGENCASKGTAKQDFASAQQQISAGPLLM